LIVPSTDEPVWVHVRVNVPLKGPLYCPDQDPVRSTVGGASLAYAVGTTAAGNVAAVVGVGVPLLVDELHPTVSRVTDTAPAMVRMMRLMDLPPNVSWFENDRELWS
jgi:hypothetical protein